MWRQGDDHALVQKPLDAAGKESVRLIDLPAMEDGIYELRVIRTMTTDDGAAQLQAQELRLAGKYAGQE